MRYLIGIDAGTTNHKAILFDEAGRAAAQAIRPAPVTALPDGQAVYDASVLWQQLCGMLRELTSAAGPAVTRQIAGIAATGMAEAGVPLSEDGSALYPFIAWYDARTASYPAWWEAHANPEEITGITGLKVQHIFSVNKLLWLREHRPELYAGMAHWACMEDYIAFRLCGVLKMDHSIGSRTMMMDLAAGQWSSSILKTAGIDARRLPELVPSGAYLGGVTQEAARLTGLPPGTPVFAGGHDHICGALACGVLDEHTVLDSSGTAEEILVASRDLARVRALGAGGFNVGRHVASGLYYMASGIPASGATMDWFARQFPLSQQQMRARRPGAGGLLFLPHLRGSSSPLRNAASCGAFLGIRPFHTPADFSQAVYEGLCYEFRLSVEGLTREHPPQRILAIGGGTKNEHWMQTKANVTGIPIVVPAVQESTALGAALLAGIGAGIYESPAAAAQRVCRVGRTVLPEPEHFAAYQRRFSIYSRLCETLLPIHQDLEEVQT